MIFTNRPGLHIIFVALAALALFFTCAPWVEAQDGPVPAQPTGLSTAPTHNSVTLTWDNPGDDSITHYQVLRRDRDIHDTGEFVTINSNTGSAATSYTDTSAQPQKRYVYRVEAVNAHGVSNWSSFARANTPAAPAQEPTAVPTAEPTAVPTAEPTVVPTQEPTVVPTAEPTVVPTAEPTVVPTQEPTAAPTAEPTVVPTAEPTAAPTQEPTAAPTAEPTVVPTAEPTAAPTAEPTVVPTAEPTVVPTAEPTVVPTQEPTAVPTAEPTAVPTQEPTVVPTAEPTAAPTAEPTVVPTAEPTVVPTQEPTAVPTAEPTAVPTAEPTAVPTAEPTAAPTQEPTPETEPALTLESLAPSGLTAKAAVGGVTLSWTAPAEGAASVTGYEILRGPSDDALDTLVADTQSTATTYTDETATDQGESYLYQVKALRDGEKSQGSNVAWVFVPTLVTVIEPVPTPQPTAITSALAMHVVDICGRTQMIQDAIMAAIPATDCAMVTASELTSVTRLDFDGNNPFNRVTSLQTGDLDGLSGLLYLNFGDGFWEGAGVPGFSSIPMGLFDDLTSLETLDIADNNQVSSLPDGVFDQLTKLIDLDISGSSVSSLPDGVFDQLTNLEKLRIDRSYRLFDTAGDLDVDIFENLTNLTHLWLERNHNYFSSSLPPMILPAGLFDGLTNLEALNLNDSFILELPAGIFDDLTNLETLVLQSTRLPDIPCGITDSLKNLKYLYLAVGGNDIENFRACVFRPLEKLEVLTTGFGSSFQERPRTRQLLTLLPNLTTFNQQPFDHSVLNATPTDLSIVAFVHTDVVSESAVYGNNLTWVDQRCDGLGDPGDYFQYVWRIEYYGQVIEHEATVYERDGRCHYAHTDYYDPPRWAHLFQPGVTQFYEVTKRLIRKTDSDPPFTTVAESETATFTGCAASPYDLTSCWRGDARLNLNATGLSASRKSNGQVTISWNSITNHGLPIPGDHANDYAEDGYVVRISGGERTSNWALIQLTTVFERAGYNYTVIHPTANDATDKDEAFTYTLKLLGGPTDDGSLTFLPNATTFLKIECPAIGSLASVTCYRVTH